MHACLSSLVAMSSCCSKYPSLFRSVKLFSAIPQAGRNIALFRSAQLLSAIPHPVRTTSVPCSFLFSYITPSFSCGLSFLTCLGLISVSISKRASSRNSGWVLLHQVHCVLSVRCILSFHCSLLLKLGLWVLL